MLEIANLHKIFMVGGVAPKGALSGVDLKVCPGQFVTIIGSNGAGKSTLLNAIAGVFPVDRGIILLDKEDITLQPEHERAARIGRVFQNPLQGTAASMSVEENLAMARRRGQRRGLNRGLTRQGRERIKQSLCVLGLGLEDRLHSAVGLLSGGQRQALALVMATLARPSLLLLDEHTAALDPTTAEQIILLTERLVAQEGLTTLMITHNLEQALRLGDRTIMMHEGQIVLSISGPERARMGVDDLLQEFRRVRGAQVVDDSLLLTTTAH
ncbi:MAG: ABC transporter ATP-binding protein [Limnochordia bacterium]